jgi:TetR/AcrR family transcriptional regulator
MKSNQKNKPRRVQILDAFAHMLAANPGARITTAVLAKQVGVSEAALYRHFPSKTKMFEGLIESIEESIFSRMNLVTQDDSLNSIEKCEQMLATILDFAEKNPGVTRILTGDALAGETERLHQRVVQLFERVETSLKQVLREGELREGVGFTLPIAVVVGLWLATVEGKIAQYVRSQFRQSPSSDWQEEWSFLARGYMTREAA